MNNLKTIVLASAMALTATSASALEFNAELGATSDYVFRGISMNDENPAIQGGVEVTSVSGWHGSLWASEVADYDDTGAQVLINAGWGSSDLTDAGRAFSYDIAVTHYVYTAEIMEDFTELNLYADTALWGGTIGLGLNYSPEVEEDFTGDNVQYFFGEVGYGYVVSQLWDTELRGAVGYSNFDSDIVDETYTNWNLGATKAFAVGPGEIVVDLDFHDTNLDSDLSDRRVVLGAKYAF